MKNKIDKDYVIYNYDILKKSIRDIAKEIGVDRITLSKFMNKNNIKKRDFFIRKTNGVLYTDENFSGIIFGKLTVVKMVKGGWLCKCLCGQTKILSTRRLINDKVESCGHNCPLKKIGNKHHFWKGYGEIPMSLYKHIYTQSLERNIEFDISIEFLWNLYLKQNKKCAISNVEIFFTKNNITASLDRIDSKIGYYENNVQWVHKTINKIKFDLDQQDFIKWCKIIADANKDI